jgi:hypothetical protein
MEDFIRSSIPHTGDKEADTANEAQAVAGVHAAFANQLENAEKHVAAHPEDKAAAQKLEYMREKQFGSMDTVAKAKILSGIQLKQLAKKEHSNWNSFASTATSNPAPIQWIKKVETPADVKQFNGASIGDYVSDQGDVIPARFVEKKGTTLGMGGMANQDFSVLIRK